MDFVLLLYQYPNNCKIKNSYNEENTSDVFDQTSTTIFFMYLLRIIEVLIGFKFNFILLYFENVF